MTSKSAERILVVGDPVVALDEQTLIPDGAVIVEGSTIVAVGPREQLAARGPFDRVIGSRDHLVMPGFINCHYHSELAAGPGLYQLIFERANVHIHSSYGPMDEEDLATVLRWGLVQAIKGGQTGAVDMFYGRPAMPDFGAEVALSVYDEIGFRVAFGLVSRDQNTYVHEPDEAFLARLPADLATRVRQSPMGYAWPVDDVMASYDRLVRRWDGRGDRIRVLLAPDWTPACSDDLYRRCRAAADHYGTGITSHVLETRAEALWNVRTHGRPALERLADLGVLGPDLVCAHFVWVTDDELRIFADSGAVASNNPGSNLRLSSGICRARDILATGGRLAFGTDGISFTDREDFFAELRLATMLARDPRVFDEIRLDSAGVLRAAGENGSRALRMEGRVGRLAPGTFADLLVVDTRRILFPPGRYDSTPVLDVLVDRASAADIDTVLIHGKVVMAGGRVTVVDEDALVDRLAEVGERRLYRPTADERRWAALGAEVEPYVLDFYRPWYETRHEPASVYNARRLQAPPDPVPTESKSNR
ncbi:amidohydrolase family protein [Parafrankia sp. EUN1f]|uniref:amidohydrolase family protein n=1 Tax=Parafrankia sp. EUN1f TaxID=102897 RepID=UPI0001C43F33|nr:amidohydrolase family protein [Parafrankia sp. EUN1f]EFC83005.1 amidohydrolase [Parafrankia sp. EUN1f]